MENKNILITGCTRGLGLTISIELLKNGYNIYGISRNLTKEFQDLIDSYPNRVTFLSFDLTNSNQLDYDLIKKFIPNQIKLCGFINNAAFAYDDIVTNLDYDKLQKMYHVNVFSPFLLTKYFIRNLIYNRLSGSIIHISSISAHTGYKGLSMYASTKGALEAFSKNTAREWGERGVRSNTIVAGFMDTDMSSTLSDEMKDRIYKRTSLKKPTNPISVANMLLFLLSDKSESITGQNIFVDSGTI